MGATNKYKTRDLFKKLQCLNKEQLLSLGLTYPPQKGWKKVVIAHFGLNQPQKEKSIIKNKKLSKKDGFYSSWEWKKLRYNVLLKYGRRCMCCGATPPDAIMVVDHIKPRKKYPELSLNMDNLQVLCRCCNMGKSNNNYTDFR